MGKIKNVSGTTVNTVEAFKIGIGRNLSRVVGFFVEKTGSSEPDSDRYNVIDGPTCNNGIEGLLKTIVVTKEDMNNVRPVFEDTSEDDISRIFEEAL